MNRPPESRWAELSAATWPAARAGDALYALAQEAKLPVRASDLAPLPDHLPASRLHTWIEATAERGGLQAEQVFVALDELELLLKQSAPALLRLAALEGAPFLAVLGCRGRHVLAWGPDLRVHRVRVQTVQAIVRQPFESPVEAGIDQILDRMELDGRSRARARTKMLADRLRAVRFRGCWLVHLPPGAAIAAHAREKGLTRRVIALVAAHLGQYAIFVMSWLLLGRAVLNGTLDRGWLLGWVLLLLSLLPVRLMATRTQGLMAVSIGAWLRRRLLRGAFRVDRQEIRHQGAGQLFGLVVEAAAVDALALTGGISAVFSLIELICASVVLWLGAGPFPAILLAGWTSIAGYLAWRYFRRGRTWTHERLFMTHELLESMVGHRTRLVQQGAKDRYRQEDESLARYIDEGDAMDRSGLWLAALVPRGWLVLGVFALLPLLAQGASPGHLAILIGGILLAYRALLRLASGLSSLTGAVIAGQSIASLARAASVREHGALPSTVSSRAEQNAPAGPAAQITDVTFRYRAQGEPILRSCNLVIERGTRVLLEGPSGAGKTTLASILAGLESPESGLLLVGGLDRSALGAAGWRERVLMAPQAHDNYLVGGTLAMNLLMGRRWPPERSDLLEAETVCRELGLSDLLDRLPSGLHQVVGETGWQLSQGERVRVFLARALLQQPELLVLDESFSALDPDNVERAVRCVVNRASTVLAIAHP